MKKTFKYTRRSVRRKGHRDGRSMFYTFWPLFKKSKTPYPLIQQEEPAIFENELLDAAHQQISNIAEIWKKVDKKLKTNYCQALAKRNRSLDLFEECEADVAPEEASVRTIADEILAFTEPGISHVVAILFHIILFATELFFNSVVFQSFGFDKAESLLTSVGVGLSITICAYLMGKYVKKENKTNSDKILIYAIPSVVLLGLIAISTLRGSYMIDVENITQVHFSMSPTLATIMFFFLNIVMFLAGAAISYASFSKNEELRNTLKKRYRHAIKRLKQEKKEAKAASEELEESDKVYIKAHQERQKEYERHLNHAKTIKEKAEYLVSTYRVANLEKRLDSVKPNCFKKPQQDVDISLYMPLTLGWDCEFDNE